jgi:hypothetical protein
MATWDLDCPSCGRRLHCELDQVPGIITCLECGVKGDPALFRFRYQGEAWDPALLERRRQVASTLGHQQRVERQMQQQTDIMREVGKLYALQGLSATLPAVIQGVGCLFLLVVFFIFWIVGQVSG